MFFSCSILGRPRFNLAVHIVVDKPYETVTPQLLIVVEDVYPFFWIRDVDEHTFNVHSIFSLLISFNFFQTCQLFFFFFFKPSVYFILAYSYSPTFEEPQQLASLPTSLLIKSSLLLPDLATHYFRALKCLLEIPPCFRTLPLIPSHRPLL